MVVDTFDLDESMSSDSNSKPTSPSSDLAPDQAVIDMRIKLKEAQYKNAVAEAEIAKLKIQVGDLLTPSGLELHGGHGPCCPWSWPWCKMKMALPSQI